MCGSGGGEGRPGKSGRKVLGSGSGITKNCGEQLLGTFEELKDHFARKTVNSRVNNTKEWGPNPEGREGPRTFCPKS